LKKGLIVGVVLALVIVGFVLGAGSTLFASKYLNQKGDTFELSADANYKNLGTD
jgi:hypothetical protein